MELQFHPWTELFSLADGNRFALLAQDIKRDGLVEPIVTYEGRILDGRNRYRACSLMGLEPRFIKFRDLRTEQDPLTWMVQKNIEQRNLGKGQLAALGLDLLMLKSEPPYTEKQLREAAALVGAGWSSVERLAAIQKRSPDLVQAVRTGRSSVAAASRDAGFQEYDSPLVSTDTIFGKGDKFREATQPLSRYLKGWRGRDFEFRHVNPREAASRVKIIDELIEGLQTARDDLESRSAKSQLTH